MSDSLEPTTGPVIACIDGGDDGERALRYAIEEARRRQTGVRIVHVVPELAPGEPMARLAPTYSAPVLRDLGSQHLQDAVEQCRTLAPDLTVDGTLRTGPRIPCIVDESESASAVVLGTREWVAHRFGGSTSGGVAAHAHCPVVTVPPGWQSGEAKDRIMVGVDSSAGPSAVVERAFEEARARHATLVIAHAWAPPHAYGGVFGTFTANQWRAEMDAWLTEQTLSIRSLFPDVKVEQVVRFDADRTSLAGLAGSCDLLMLGRHRHSLPLIHPLGSVARNAIHAGTSAVEVIPVDAG